MTEMPGWPWYRRCGIREYAPQHRSACLEPSNEESIYGRPRAPTRRRTLNLLYVIRVTEKLEDIMPKDFVLGYNQALDDMMDAIQCELGIAFLLSPPGILLSPM